MRLMVDFTMDQGIKSSCIIDYPDRETVVMEICRAMEMGLPFISNAPDGTMVVMGSKILVFNVTPLSA